MPVIINIALSIMTVLAFILCGFYSLFRNTSLITELETLKSSYLYNECKHNGEKFTLFLTQRKLDWWITIAKELAGRSMLISLIIGLLQWGASLKVGGGFDEVRQFLEKPGFLFYAQFALLSYVSISMAMIDHTVRSFSRIQKQ